MRIFRIILLALLLLLLFTYCSVPTVFFYSNTMYPIEKLDSLGIANKIQIKDTLYWERSYYRTDEGSYSTYFWSTTESKTNYIMSIGKLQNDSIWELRFRKEGR